jgi:hypothetical protein
MNNLRRIGNHKRKGPDYLGVCGSFLIETLDDDKILAALAPKYFNFWDSKGGRLCGPEARLILKNFRNEALIIIKSTRDEDAELVVIAAPSWWLNADLVADIKRLASHRWPSRKLFIKVSTIRKAGTKAADLFRKAGWIQSPGSRRLEIQLYHK